MSLLPRLVEKKSAWPITAGKLWRSGPLVLALALLSVPVWWPFVQHGLFATHDTRFHLVRLAVLDSLVRAGYMYPRWMPELAGGYGYATFNFYAPGVFYLAETFRLLGASHAGALIASNVACVLVAGAGAYRLAGDIFRRSGAGVHWPALVAGAAYMYSPYLLSNLYFRGAIAEMGAQALLPWVVCAFRRLVTAAEPRAWVLPSAVGLAALAVTHNSTVLVLQLFLAPYLLFLWWIGKRRVVVACVLGAGLGATALSAFFWAPALLERAYLSAHFAATSRGWMHTNYWEWPDWRTLGTSAFSQFPNFLNIALDWGNGALTYQLHLPQVVLAGLGLGLARGARKELLFCAGVAVVLSVAIFRATEPAWLAVPSLALLQFPWRLLSVVGLLLALLTGGMATRAASRGRATAAGMALLAVIVVTQVPRPHRTQPLTVFDPVLGPAAVAQYELETGEVGANLAQDFLLRWSGPPEAFYKPIEGMPSGAVADRVRLSAASDLALTLEVDSQYGNTLRFAGFYYPGWRLETDSGERLPLYAAGRLGLLAADIPPGPQRLRLAWGDTPLVAWATGLSLAGLAVLAALGWHWRQRWAAGGLLLALVAGLGMTFVRPGPQPVQAPTAPFTAGGLELLGLRTRLVRPGHLLIEPVWYVRDLPQDLLFHWALLDSGGRTVAQTSSRPHHHTQSALHWVRGLLVNDDHQLELPPGLPAGDYRLTLDIQPVDVAPSAPASRLVTGEVRLPARTPAAPPLAPALYHLGESLSLRGFEMVVNGRRWLPDQPLPAVRAGDTLVYRVYWSAERPVLENYHGFVHLVRAGGPVLKVDQLAGQAFNPPRLWDPYNRQPDEYRFVIQPNVPSGFYAAQLGLYSLGGLESLPVRRPDGQPAGDRIELPPVKIVAAADSAPQQPLAVRLEAFAEVIGYDLALPEGGLRPGGTFALTLYYRSLEPTARDAAVFVHLYDPVLGMAAQSDGPPQQGGNPTWSWMPGEVVVDTLTLTVAPDAPRGDYTLRTGLYDAAQQQRLAVTDSQGQPLANDEINLTVLTVGP